MKWAQVNQILRNAFAKGVTVEPEEYREYFLFELRETDTFHPWDTDSWLCELTHNTNLDEVDRDDLESALAECLCEMEDKLYDWFDDRYNHAPGYTKPDTVKFDIDIAFTEFFAKLLDKTAA